jgi:hypothetical protein
VTLVDAQANRVQLSREKIDDMRASELSLMPEGLLDPLDDQETADLIGYLRSEPDKKQGLDDTLPGTRKLDLQGDLAEQMVAGIDRFLLRQIDASVATRKPTREKLKAVLGLVDERETPALFTQPIPGTTDLKYARWDVIRGVRGEGLIHGPDDARSTVIILPDADWSPEQTLAKFSGSGMSLEKTRVIIVSLLDRSDAHSVSLIGSATNQPHREFAYRPAFMVGRTVVGYEVQKTLALLDLFPGDVTLMGIGEGGLVALAAAALDERVAMTYLFGWFSSRQRMWEEPIYRNLFGFLKDFGDAELAQMIAPRRLVVEPGPALRIDGPPAPRPGRGGAAPGFWASPDAEAQQAELARAGLSKRPKEIFRAGAANSLPALDRAKRQLGEILADTQVLLAASERARNEFVWKKVSRKSVEEFEKST